MAESSPSKQGAVAGSGALERNSVLNFIGHGLPLLAALIAVPYLIDRMGTEKYGVLVLAWAVVGYFGLFDFGLGRALTQSLAERLGRNQTEDIPPLIWMSLFMLIVLGVLGAIVMISMTPLLVNDLLNIPDSLASQSLYSLLVLALALPIIVSSAALQGVIEAYQRFDWLLAVRAPSGMFIYLGPCIALWFTTNLVVVVAVLAIARLVAWLAYFVICVRLVPTLRFGIRYRRDLLSPLVRFGAWITVSNVLSPLLVTLDRFVIGSVASMAAVAYYTTPYDMVTRLWLFPQAVLGVLFPTLSSTYVSDIALARRLYQRSILYVFVPLLPICAFLIAFGHNILATWISPTFALESAYILQVLTIGVLLNSLARVPHVLLQAAGRPDVTVKVYLLELPFYLLLLWFAISRNGAIGAAWVWTLRIVVDCLLMFGLSYRLTTIGVGLKPQQFFGMLIFSVLLFPSIWSMELNTKIAAFLVFMVAFTLAGWFVILDREDRQSIQKYTLQRLRLKHRPKLI